VPQAENAFSSAVRRLRTTDTLVVQPRMGFPDPRRMLGGLRAVAALPGTVGTITLDSYTRTEQYEAARDALHSGRALNGYPLLAHAPDATAGIVGQVESDVFPVQVRHGAPRPFRIFQAMLDAGLTATEGGPISYCLPYGRTPLHVSLTEWARSCEMLAAHDAVVHVESFAGCMLGQLCPPSLLLALSILEGLFITSHGVRSISLSYAQQTDFGQDVAAITALRRLAREFLPGVDRHLVVYTYMGLFPRSVAGARRLLEVSAQLAHATRAHRLVVKTLVESRRLPTIQDNVKALRIAAMVPPPPPERTAAGAHLVDEVYDEALRLIHTALELRPQISSAILAAFRAGLLDVPYCLHPDNANAARAAIDADGRLIWAHTGRMPIGGRTASTGRVRSGDLLEMLSHVQRSYDSMAAQDRRRTREDPDVMPSGRSSAPPSG
jgi:methylaspartate mutase epsilon subunit